ncbi:hypothetical protein VTJ49DRAFT_211 [Mycothermus thermophilus]|uniref:C2H2-type domain-containing protein n=1 Tax=Humicola insolens TaxID=85995 RepID=A0ABR3VHS6_HUMIN
MTAESAERPSILTPQQPLASDQPSVPVASDSTTASAVGQEYSLTPNGPGTLTATETQSAETVTRHMAKDRVDETRADPFKSPQASQPTQQQQLDTKLPQDEHTQHPEKQQQQQHVDSAEQRQKLVSLAQLVNSAQQHQHWQQPEPARAGDKFGPRIGSTRAINRAIDRVSGDPCAAPNCSTSVAANKPVIMDPPAARKSSQPQRPASIPMGFPSPTRDYANSNPKFVDDTARIRDFGGKMVAEAKQELMAHFTTEILDEVADVIIERASDGFLDKCLEKRLLTIEAKPLINMLAKAERLGYEPTDIVQDGQERVIPQGTQQPTATTTQALADNDARRFQCLDCYRTFVFEDAFNYHKKWRVCMIDPPSAEGFTYACPDCGEGFVRAEDREAHLENRACGDHGQPPRPRPGPGRPPKTVQPFKDPTATPPPAQSRHHTPGIPGPKLPQQSTPASGKKYLGTPSDPYAHLTPEMREQMEQELREAELKYAPRFHEAHQIPDEETRRQKLDGLRNSFGTKQSMIRKKYGVRLRERRTKAEIIAEKERMGLATLEKVREPERPTPETDAIERAAKEGTKSGSGWTAANTPRANAVWEDHGAKRQRLDQSGTYKSPYTATAANDTPTRKTPLPALQPARVYEQSGARVEVHEPARPGTSASASGSATPTGSERGASGECASASAPQPVIVDDSSDDDDDEDIPSTLPSHVRKSLASSSSPASLLQNNP